MTSASRREVVAHPLDRLSVQPLVLVEVGQEGDDEVALGTILARHAQKARRRPAASTLPLSTNQISDSKIASSELKRGQ